MIASRGSTAGIDYAIRKFSLFGGVSDAGHAATPQACGIRRRAFTGSNTTVTSNHVTLPTAACAMVLQVATNPGSGP